MHSSGGLGFDLENNKRSGFSVAFMSAFASLKTATLPHTAATTFDSVFFISSSTRERACWLQCFLGCSHGFKRSTIVRSVVLDEKQKPERLRFWGQPTKSV